MKIVRFDAHFCLALVILAGCSGKLPDRPQKGAGESHNAGAGTAFTPQAGDERQLRLADFNGFQTNADTWREEDGVLICSGTPKGYIYTTFPVADAHIEAEFRYVPADDADAEMLENSNTGFMLFIQEPHKQWPVSLEVQGRFWDMGQVKSNGGAAELTIQDHDEVRQEVRNPVGKWSRVEIITENGGVTAKLNGEVVCVSEPSELQSGRFGLQSEGYEIHFRNLHVHWDSTPPKASR